MRTCSDCGASEGGFHKPGCDLEECPFCLGQLVSCRCRYAELGLLDEAHATTGYLPPRVHEHGLDAPAAHRWANLLEDRGRRRFASPDDDDEPRARAALVAHVVEIAASGGFHPISPGADTFQAALVALPGHGALVARVYPGFLGRDPRTGAPLRRPPIFFPGHLPEASDAGLVHARELVDAARTCAAQIGAGAAHATWPGVGVLERGFSWHGMTRRPRVSLSLSWKLEDDVTRLTVPPALARMRPS